VDAWVIVKFVDFLAWLDTLFRKRASRSVPRFHELLDDPASYFAAADVRIGPGNRYVSGVLLAIPLGLIIWCGIGWGILMDGKPLPELKPEQRMLAYAIAIGGVVVTVAAVLYWLRGGEMILSREGAELRFRN
jgi:hypothetical protein